MRGPHPKHTMSKEDYQSILDRRGVKNPCPLCKGLGVRSYSSGALWERGVVSTASFAQGVCDVCWGSGDANRPWEDLRALDEERRLKERVGRLEDFALRAGIRLSASIAAFEQLADEIEKMSRRRKPPAPWWEQTCRLFAISIRESIEAIQKERESYDKSKKL